MLGDQNVGSLHVPVYDLVRVDVVESVEELLHYTLDLAQRELDIEVREQPCQVVLTEVKDEVKGGLVPVELAGLAAAYLNQVDNVLVVEKLQYPALSQRRDGEPLLLVVHEDLFQCDDLGPVLLVPGLEDLAKGPLADLGQLLVLGDLLAEGEVEVLDVLEAIV